MSFRTRRNGSASPRQAPANALGQLADIHEQAIIGEDNDGKAEEACKNYRPKGLGQTEKSYDFPDAHASEAHKLRGCYRVACASSQIKESS